MHAPSYRVLEGAVPEASIYRRNGGCAVQVDGKVYVWGGEGSEQRTFPSGDIGDEEDDSEDDSEDGEEDVVNLWTVTVLPPPRFNANGAPFDVYDMHTCAWRRIKTSGDVPSLGLGSSLNYHHDTSTIYLFGGFNDGHFDANIYRVRVDDWNWQKVEIADGRMKPSGRYLTAVLIHKSRLCVFGGVGTDIVKINGIAQDLGATYIVAHSQGEGFGWNNEYYEFNMESDQWNAPLGQDTPRPEPVGGHCFVQFDTYRALLFGGRYESGRKNDTWIFDLEQRKFTEQVKFCESSPVPTGRSFATLTPLIDPLLVGQKLGGCGPSLQQRMLLLWGKQQNEVILPEVWILKIQPEDNFTWRKFSVNLLPRSWHTASPLYYPNSTECRLAIFGGNAHSEGFVGKRRNIGDMRVLTFGVVSLCRLCATVIARDGRDLSTYALSPNFLPYKLIDQAMKTFRDSKPIVMEHFF